MRVKPVQILMIEDNEGDVILTKQALQSAKVANEISVVTNGAEALDFVRRKEKYADAARPDLIMLDLNIPCRDGRQVLAEIKADPELRQIPVVVLTGSSAEQDIAKAYDLHANCYVLKPVGLKTLVDVVRSIETFWLTVVQLPGTEP